MNLVGLKELSELLDVSYDTLKVWKNRDRLPEPLQVISGTPVWDWDESEEDFRSIQKNENSGRPRKPNCLLYTSPSPRDRSSSRMPSSA